MNSSDSLLGALACAYDESSRQYDRWSWQSIWRRCEFPRIISALRKAFPSPKILDLGCGTGALAEEIRGSFKRYVGVDASRGMIDVARSRQLQQSEFQVGDMLSSNRDGESFDAVVSLRSMSHCRSPLALIQQSRRSLRPGGLLVLSDVAPEHRYEETRIPTLSGKRSVPTYKHSIDSILQCLKPSHGFQLESIIELNGNQIAEASRNQCRSIDVSGRTPFGRIYFAHAE